MLFKKNIVVMDGTDINVLNEIVGVVGMLSFKRSIKLRRLDKDHPTIKVITFRTTKRNFDEIKNILERAYGGLINYNVRL